MERLVCWDCKQPDNMAANFVLSCGLFFLLGPKEYKKKLKMFVTMKWFNWHPTLYIYISKLCLAFALLAMDLTLLVDVDMTRSFKITTSKLHNPDSLYRKNQPIIKLKLPPTFALRSAAVSPRVPGSRCMLSRRNQAGSRLGRPGTADTRRSFSMLSCVLSSTEMVL